MIMNIMKFDIQAWLDNVYVFFLVIIIIISLIFTLNNNIYVTFTQFKIDVSRKFYHLRNVDTIHVIFTLIQLIRNVIKYGQRQLPQNQCLNNNQRNVTSYFETPLKPLGDIILYSR